MNNKGFLLVETIVVATFLLTVLTILFLQFKNLIVSYNNSYNYNTVEGIYNLNTVRNYILAYESSENPLSKQLKDKSVEYLTLYNGTCNPDLGLSEIESDGLCEQIMKAGNFKTIIFSHSDPTALQK